MPDLSENHNRVVDWVNRILDAPLPPPRDVRRAWRGWLFLLGFCAGALAVVLFIIVPPVFS